MRGMVQNEGVDCTENDSRRGLGGFINQKKRRVICFNRISTANEQAQSGHFMPFTFRISLDKK